MTEPLRIGVLGAGWFASRRHLPDIQRCADARLTALCRRDPEALARMADHFGVSATYTDYRQMLDEEALDAVLIATPHSLHFEQARDALERGLHVLIEKPMTVRGEDARALVDLARRQGRQLVTALNPPYWAHCHVRRRWGRDEGRAGALECVDIRWLGAAAHVFGKAPMPGSLPGVVPPTLFRGDPALCGGGVLIDGGSHLVSEILWVTGLHVTRVHAMMDDPDTDLRTALVMETDAGVSCTLTMRGDSAHPERRVHSAYYGSAATACVDGMPFRLSLRDTGGAGECVTESEMPAAPTPVGNFVAAVRGEAEPLGAPEHAAEVVAVIEAAYRSARSGEAVAVPAV